VMQFQERLYRLSTWLYFSGISLASFFSNKAKKWVAGRKDIFPIKHAKLNDQSKTRIWFHCASLGEFEQARPIIEALKAKEEPYLIILTFFSPSGFEVRKGYSEADIISYLPEDNPRNAQIFIEQTKPDLAVFIKYEFWYYFISTLRENNIPVILASSIFRSNQLFFSPFGGFYRKMLKLYSAVLVQNTASSDLLKSIDISSTVVSDLRFDRVLSVAQNNKLPENLIRYDSLDKILIGGSTWPADDKVLSELFDKHLKARGFRLIIAPHLTDKTSIKNCRIAYGNTAVLHSEWKDSDDIPDILIIDSIGLLSSLYRLGTYCYLGGAFGAGLHNTLEAAVYGKPIFFGPTYEKFNEAIQLVGLGVAKSINNSSELYMSIELIESSGTYDETCKKAAEYVTSNSGGTIKTLEIMEKLLNSKSRV